MYFLLKRRLPDQQRWHFVGAALLPLLLSACALPRPPLPLPLAPAPGPAIRLLLSFDDGPSARATGNPSARVLDSLARNAVQPGIKALFFVQTANDNGGATPLGQQLLRQAAAQGHLLGFHTATPGHTSHTRLDDAALERSLHEGLAAHRRVAGAAPRLLRPPHWDYDARTFSAYQRHGLQLLMTDLSANDGKVLWPNGSLRRRSHFEQQMHALRERLHEIPDVDGVRPVVVTFHDTNPYTARHLEEYLQILIASAQQAGLRLHDKPFYDRTDDIEAAALTRTVGDGSTAPQRIPGFWTSLRLWLTRG